MAVRYIQTYDTFGNDGEPRLQEWDTDARLWIDVNTYRIPEHLEAEYNSEEYS